MLLSDFKKLSINGVELKQLFMDGVHVWKSGYKNWVKFSTEADGVTIYNGGLGYKNGYRVRSGGAETTQTTSVCTGYIPVKAGDIVRVNSRLIQNETGLNSAINVFGSDLTCYGQIVGNSGGEGYSIFQSTWKDYGISSIVHKDGYYEWIVPPTVNNVNCSYIRVTGPFTDGSEMIVTVNEVIV